MKPLLIIAALVGSVTAGLSAAHVAATHYDAQGHPVGTWAGDGLACPECRGYLAWQREHDYRCRGCGRTCRIKLDDHGAR